MDSLECIELKELCLMPCLVGNGKFLPSLGPAFADHPPPVGCCHAASESMLVFSLPVRWLECPLHCLPVLIEIAKVMFF